MVTPDHREIQSMYNCPPEMDSLQSIIPSPERSKHQPSHQRSKTRKNSCLDPPAKFPSTNTKLQQSRIPASLKGTHSKSHSIQRASIAAHYPRHKGILNYQRDHNRRRSLRCEPGPLNGLLLPGPAEIFASSTAKAGKSTSRPVLGGRKKWTRSSSATI